jgi:hypothetical protein
VNVQTAKLNQHAADAELPPIAVPIFVNNAARGYVLIPQITSGYGTLPAALERAYLMQSSVTPRSTVMAGEVAQCANEVLYAYEVGPQVGTVTKTDPILGKVPINDPSPIEPVEDTDRRYLEQLA